VADLDLFVGIDYSGAETADEHDAYSVAGWLLERSTSGLLAPYSPRR
jgi:hypothetical protein